MSEELFDKKNNQIRQNGLIMSIDEVVDLLNSQSKFISAYNYEFARMNKENKKLKEENEQLRTILFDTVSKIEEWYGNDYPNAIYKATIQITPKMYGEIKKIIKGDGV